MCSETIIDVSHLTKVYKLYAKKSDVLREALSPTKKQYHKPFYALNDVSFAIQRGETIGIIGTNGSGKSTLLKILTGVTTPTSGCVHVDGKISALLELGAGFNMDYTGLENIALQGTIMGYTPEEMEKKTADIIDFADIGSYIEQPVKNYSSGMFTRLAFSVAVSVEPDILIVDEALSVGDMRFQIKCMDRMKAMMEKGTTVLFVSHDINAIRRFCKRSIWLNHGTVQAIGDTNDVADAYTDFLKCGTLNQVAAFTYEDVASAEVNAANQEGNERIGGIASLVSFTLRNGQGEETDTVRFDEPVVATIEYDVLDDTLNEPVLGVALRSIDDDYVCGLNTLLDRVEIPWKLGRNRFSIRYPQGLRVLGGKYYFTVGVKDRTASVDADYRLVFCQVQVKADYVGEGRFIIPHHWEV